MRYCFGIFLEELRKTITNTSQDRRWPRKIRTQTLPNAIRSIHLTKHSNWSLSCVIIIIIIIIIIFGRTSWRIFDSSSPLQQMCNWNYKMAFSAPRVACDRQTQLCTALTRTKHGTVVSELITVRTYLVRTSSYVTTCSENVYKNFRNCSKFVIQVSTHLFTATNNEIILSSTQYILSCWTHSYFRTTITVGRDSSVGIAICCGLDRSMDRIPVGGRDFPHSSRPALGPRPVSYTMGNNG